MRGPQESNKTIVIKYILLQNLQTPMLILRLYSGDECRSPVKEKKLLIPIGIRESKPYNINRETTHCLRCNSILHEEGFDSAFRTF